MNRIAPPGEITGARLFCPARGPDGITDDENMNGEIMNGEIILHAGEMTLGLAPGAGGSITRFTWTRSGGTLNMMRPAPAGKVEMGATDPRDMASFPLVPFSGRIDHARFPFQGQEIQLQPNFPPGPHAIHGDGWTGVWTVAAQDERSARLTFDHDRMDDALRYRAEQRFSLTADGFTLEMSVTNVGKTPIPAGMGMHPYFIKTPSARLTTPVNKVWMLDEMMMPTTLVDVPAAWDFTSGLTMSQVTIDNGFSGWPGEARIEWPEWNARLHINAAPQFSHLVVFCPPGDDYFCVEPVSNTANGFNLMARGVPDTGVVVLAPGQTLLGEITFRVESLD